MRIARAVLSFGLTAWGCVLFAEDGSAAWLRYARVDHPKLYQQIPARIVITGSSPTEDAAGRELRAGLASMLGRDFSLGHGGSKTGQDAIVLVIQPKLAREEFHIRVLRDQRSMLISGSTPTAVLYGVFHLLEEVATERPIPAAETQSPSAPVRWVDQWDNSDGSIERGYAGRSIFFDNGGVRVDLSRAGEYARLLASVGINGCNVNNVNAAPEILTTPSLREIGRIADAFRPWGVRLSLSVDLSSPQALSGLKTFDPLDPQVTEWWRGKVDEIYSLIPDFGGFTVKADSEGKPGPSQYGRSPADAANMLARALKPHGGIVLYRGFVYNNHLDWRDPKADRARAGYDNFARLDGRFDDNVIVQIKHGPIDFQVREPVSPLFAALRHTNSAVELQATQEYTGQQRHMVWLAPMWKWALDTDMRVEGRYSPLKEIVEGKRFHRPLGGYVSVVNVGMDANWLHHPMAMANLYGFGRIAWDPEVPASRIIDDWTRLTWGNNPAVVAAIDAMQLASWQNYENYTGPNGMGTLTNILGSHYGPGIESAERNGWGMWFRGDHAGIGMDRAVATGTGFIGQYPPEMAAKYESLATCPDDLLLFFHHVPYNYRIHSGKTLVQSVYDNHYAGARAAAGYVTTWKSLEGLVDSERYAQTLKLLTYQAGHAIVWRDAVNDWFHAMSGIGDAEGRVGHHPNRVEAENMASHGYKVIEVQPWEDASGGKAVVCHEQTSCTLQTTFAGAAGAYKIAVQYFDLWSGISSYQLLLNNRKIADWKADDSLPPAQPDPSLDGQDSIRFTTNMVHLGPGDVLELLGTPDGGESAPVDYIEFLPQPEE